MGIRKVPYIPQMEAVECGAAALCSILGYWGHFAPLVDVREACKVSRNGVNAANILEAAKGYGFEAEAVTLEMEEINALPLPAILHWKFMHFVVLERLSKNGAWIVDPGHGRKCLDLEELGKSFTGVALCFAPDKDLFKLRPRQFPSLQRYLGLVWDLRFSLLQVLGASIMLQAVVLVFPISSQFLIDRVLLPGQKSWMFGLASALVIAVFVKAILIFLRSYVLQGIHQKMDWSLATNFIEHLVRLPVGFFLQRQAGDLIQRAESHTQIRDLLSSRTISAFLDGLLLLSLGSIMLVYYLPLALLIIAIGGVRVCVLVFLKQRNKQLMASELVAIGRERSVLVEVLSGLETVKASASQDLVLDRWTNRLMGYLNLEMARSRLTIVTAQVMTTLQGFTTAAVFIVGGMEVVQENMTLGTFVAFLTLQGLFMAPLESMLNAFTELQYLSTHLTRLDDVMEASTEPNGDQSPGRLKGKVRLQGVNFRFSTGAPWVLRGINLEIQPCEKIAIVGRSGAGKSTLARLLLGMYQPTEGEIFFDEFNLKNLDLIKFRSQLGVVLQDSFAFDDSVRTNLSLTNPEMGLDQVKWAAHMACIDEVIGRFPNGYDERLGENAKILSGGERQRLCLARAIATRPALLLLDEATSSLDLETESKVHSNLAKLNCTRIIIAHRLDTVKDADRILVLESGRIVQEGTYSILARQPGEFQEVVLAMEKNGG